MIFQYWLLLEKIIPEEIANQHAQSCRFCSRIYIFRLKFIGKLGINLKCKSLGNYFGRFYNQRGRFSNEIQSSESLPEFVNVRFKLARAFTGICKSKYVRVQFEVIASYWELRMKNILAIYTPINHSKRGKLKIFHSKSEQKIIMVEKPRKPISFLLIGERNEVVRRGRRAELTSFFHGPKSQFKASRSIV